MSFTIENFKALQKDVTAQLFNGKLPRNRYQYAQVLHIGPCLRATIPSITFHTQTPGIRWI